MKMSESFTIGKLAKACQVNVETIRFYERKGLLKRPLKNGAFRFYSHEYVARIEFIKMSQKLGFSLSEVQELLNLKVVSQAKCSDILKLTEHKIAEIDQKIKNLKRIKIALTELSTCCQDPSEYLRNCAILELLTQKRKLK